VKRPLTFIFAVAIVAAAGTFAASELIGNRPQVAAAPLKSVTAVSARLRVGVFEPGAPRSYTPLQQFAIATGVKPGIALWYSGWGDRFWIPFADDAASHGALPFVQINPGRVTMSDIASGKQDAYIGYYARAVRTFGKPVIIGFAAEMNGTWDRWGRGHVPPAQWIAAWRHFVTVFRQQGARNVIWLWTINAMNLNATSASPQPWWPGDNYVTWVGIDGYYYRATDTYQSVFGTTISAVRQFTSRPVLISETGIGPVAGPSKIASLFTSARQDHLIGIVWFDEKQDGNDYHQDWRLTDSPAALSEFSQAAKAAQR